MFNKGVAHAFCRLPMRCSFILPCATNTNTKGYAGKCCKSSVKWASRTNRFSPPWIRCRVIFSWRQRLNSLRIRTPRFRLVQDKPSASRTPWPGRRNCSNSNPARKSWRLAQAAGTSVRCSARWGTRSIRLNANVCSSIRQDHCSNPWASSPTCFTAMGTRAKLFLARTTASL